MKPFSHDFLSQFRYDSKGDTQLAHDIGAFDGWYTESSKRIHPKSWEEVAPFSPNTAPTNFSLPGVSYQRTLSNKPRRIVNRPILPQSHVFRQPDPANPRPGDEFLYLFIQRDVKKDLKDRKKIGS